MIPGRAHFGEDPEVNPILHLQRTIGNQAVRRILQTKTEALEGGLTNMASPRFASDLSPKPLHSPKSKNIQAKLMVSCLGGIYEQEADDVSEQVIRMPEPQPQRACPCGRGCPKCGTQQGDQEQVGLQAKHTRSGASAQIVVPAIVHEVLRSPGQPLDPATRRFMEPRFGHDFSKVRIHTDGKAAESSGVVRARAYTVGQSIVFGSRQYAPQTAEGQRLLAHELAHVIQQGAAGSQVDPLRPLPVGTPRGVDDHGADGVEAGKESRRPGFPTSRTALKPGVAGIVLQRQAVDPRELETETINSPRQFKISQWLVESAPGGGTSRTELYWVDFEVDSKGVMTASVRTVLPERTYRSGVLRFGDSFRDALQHFQTNGVEVNAFEGDWSYMTEDEISDNLRVFREGMEKGGTREAAALKTPTGKVATRSGFELTNVENVPESQPHLAEQGVRRWRVKAIFRRRSLRKAGHRSGIGRTKVKSFAPLGPPAKTVSGEFTSGGLVVGAKGGSQLKGESFAPVTPPARVVSGEITESRVPPAPKGGSGLGGSTLVRGANVVAGALGPVSMAAEYYNTGSLNFPIALQNSEGDTEVYSIRISDKGFEEVSSTLISEPLPRDIQTLTPAEAEKTLKEGDYFIKKSPNSTLHPWIKEFWERPDELWRILNHRAEPTGCTGYRGDFRCPPIEAMPEQA